MQFTRIGIFSRDQSLKLQRWLDHFDKATICWCCLLLLCSTGYEASAQTNNADSLYAVVSAAADDTNKVIRLIDISKQYFGSDPARAKSISEEARDLSKSLNYTSGIGYALKNIGIVHFFLSEYPDALEYWGEAIKAFEEINDKVGISNMLSNMGAIYFNQDEIVIAIDYYTRSLRLAEEIKDTIRIATALTNLGAAYSSTNENEQALDSYLKALPLFESSKDAVGIGLTSVNIGDLYYNLGNYSQAQVYHENALNYLVSTSYYSTVFHGLGRDFLIRGEYEEGLRYLDSAYTIASSLGDHFEAAKTLLTLGTTLENKGQLHRALSVFENARATSLRISNANLSLKEALQGLVRVHIAQRNYPAALESQTMLGNVKDSLFKIESAKKVHRLLFNSEIQKKEGEIALLVKDQEVQKLEVDKQKTIRNGFMSGFAGVLLFAVVVFAQRNKIKKGKKLSDSLLLNILPAEVAEELKVHGKAEARDFKMVSVLFTDFIGFTQTSQKLNAMELVSELNICFEAFDRICEKYGIEKIKTIGDSYMAAGGLPVPSEAAARNTVLAALEMQDFISQRKQINERDNKPLFEMRAGIHTGPLVAGIVGVKKFQYDIWGDTVNTASRMESEGSTGKVNISQTTYNLLKDNPQFTFESRGKIEAKGKGEIQMWYVSSTANLIGYSHGA